MAIGKTKKCPKCQESITIKTSDLNEDQAEIDKPKIEKKINPKLILGAIVLVVMFVLFPLVAVFNQPFKYVIPDDGRPWSVHIDTESQRNTAVYHAKKATSELFNNPKEVEFGKDDIVQLLNPLMDDELSYRVWGTILLPNRFGVRKKDAYSWKTEIKYFRGKYNRPIKDISLIRIDDQTIYMSEKLKKVFSEFDKAVEKANH